MVEKYQALRLHLGNYTNVSKKI